MPSTWSYGSTGTDYSANPVAAPITGYTLLLTIPVNKKRHYVEVQNLSGDTVQIVRDDGTGANVTSILLASGGTAPAQGGGWSSATFKGRLSVYAPSGTDPVSAYED